MANNILHNIITSVSDNGDSMYLVEVQAPNFPEALVRGTADWALSMQTGIDMDALQGGDWDVSEPDEQGGTWFVEYSREV